MTVLVLIGGTACGWALYLTVAWRLGVRAERRGPVRLATVAPRPVRLPPLLPPLDAEAGRLNRYRRSQASNPRERGPQW